MATALDDLLTQLEDEGIETSFISQLRGAIDEQAQNPDLVKNLRAEISKRDDRIAGFEKRERVQVLTEAGIPEKAHDRFLRDWNGEKADLEFNADNVKAAADEFGYQLTPGGDGTVAPANGSTPPDAAEQQRREAQARAAQLRAEGTVESGVPPDAATVIANAESQIAPGNRSAIQESMALKRRQLTKIAGWE